MGMESINISMRPLTDEQRNWCMKHQGLAHRLACKYSTRTGHDYDDVFQVVNMAIMKASTKYNPEKGAPSTYIYKWVASYMGRYMPYRDDGINRPDYVKSIIHNYHGWMGHFYTVNERWPTYDEKDEWLRKKRPGMHSGVRKEIIADTIVVNPVVRDSQGDEVDITEWIPDDGEVQDDAFLRREREYKIRKAMGTLSARDFDMFASLYGIDREKETLQQIGERYGLSRERVRQIAQAACDDIKDAVDKLSIPNVYRTTDRKVPATERGGRAKVVMLNPFMLEDDDGNQFAITLDGKRMMCLKSDEMDAIADAVLSWKKRRSKKR